MEERNKRLRKRERYLNGKRRRMMSVLLIVTMLFSNIGSSITTAYASVTGYTRKLHVRINSDAVVDTLLSSGGYGIDFDSEISDYLMNTAESEEISSALYEYLMEEMEQENRHLISQKIYEGLGVFLLAENDPEKSEGLSDVDLDLEEISEKVLSIYADDELIEGEADEENQDDSDEDEDDEDEEDEDEEDEDDEDEDDEDEDEEEDDEDDDNDFEAGEDREQKQLLLRDRQQVAASVEKLVLLVTNFSEESAYEVYVSMTDGEFELSEAELITTSFRQKNISPASDDVLMKQPAGNGGLIGVTESTEAESTEAESTEGESTEGESTEAESTEGESTEAESTEIESSVDTENSEGLENGADAADVSTEEGNQESENSGEIAGTNTEGDDTPYVTDNAEKDEQPEENEVSIEGNTPPMVQTALMTGTDQGDGTGEQGNTVETSPTETDPSETDPVTVSLEKKEADTKEGDDVLTVEQGTSEAVTTAADEIEKDDDGEASEEAVTIKTTEKELKAEALRAFVTTGGTTGTKAKGGYKVSVKPNTIAALVIELETKEIPELQTGTLRIENVDEELVLGDKLVTYLVQLEDADTGELEPYHGMVDFYLIGDEELVDTYEMSDGLLTLPANWAAEITDVPFGTSYDVEIQADDDNVTAGNVRMFTSNRMQPDPVEDDGMQVLFASGTSKASGSINGTEVLSSKPTGTEKAVTVYMYDADGKGIEGASFMLQVYRGGSSPERTSKKTEDSGRVAFSYKESKESKYQTHVLVYMITDFSRETLVAQYKMEKNGDILTLEKTGEIENYTIETANDKTNKPVITIRKKSPELEIRPVIQGTPDSGATFTYKITNAATGSAYEGKVEIDGISQTIVNGEFQLTTEQRAKIKTTETVWIQETNSSYSISRVLLNGAQKSNPVEYKPEREQETLAFVHKRLTEDGGVNVTKKAEQISNGLYNVELSVSGKPTSTEKTGNVNVVVVIDYSGSMAQNMKGKKSRLQIVNTAVEKMAKSLLTNGQNKMSVVGYDGDDDGIRVADWTDNKEYITKSLKDDPEGSTNCAAGFNMAKTMLASGKVDAEAQKIIVYLSDGEANRPQRNPVSAAIEAAKSINIEYPEVSIITMGISNNPGTDVLAPTGDDKYWDMYAEAQEADDVIEAFQAITNIITQKYENPVVRDTLGNHVELVDNTFSTKKNGDTFENSEIDMSEDGRTITWDLIKELEADELASFDDVYTLSYQIKVKDSINVDNTPYDKIGEVGTGTHAGNSGWWSNEEAKLYCNDNDIYEVATFPLPVVQKTSELSNPLTIEKRVRGNQERVYRFKASDAQNQPYEGSVRILNADGSTVSETVYDAEAGIQLGAGQKALLLNTVFNTAYTITEEGNPVRILINGVPQWASRSSNGNHTSGASVVMTPLKSNTKNLVTFVNDNASQGSVTSPDVEKTAVKKEGAVGQYDVELIAEPGSITPGTPVDVVVVFDLSNSMKFNMNHDNPSRAERETEYYKDNNGIDWYYSYESGKQRWNIVQDAAASLVDSIFASNKGSRVSVVGYSDVGYTLHSFSGTQTAETVKAHFAGNINDLKNNVNGGTNCKAGFELAGTQLELIKDSTNPKYVVYFTDGEATKPNNSAVSGALEAAKQLNQSYPDATIITAGISGDADKEKVTQLLNPANPEDQYNDAYYLERNVESLSQALSSITQQITASYSNVKIVDTLGEYVDVTPETTIKGYTKTKGKAETWTEMGGASITVSGDTITWDIGTMNPSLEYKLAYSVDVDVWKTGYNAAAYPNRADGNTGTHSGQEGYYSNENAVLYYNSSSQEFPKPVVQQNPNTIKIKKVDGKGSTLSGVTFTVTRSGEQTGVSKTTDADGMAEFTNLYDYEYVVTETPRSNYTGVAPFKVDFTGKEGYSANGSVSPITADSTRVSTVSGMEGLVTVTNYVASADFPVKKIDASDNAKALSGAVFELQTKNAGGWTTVSGSQKTTQADGTASFTGLHAGTVYKVLETKAPENYQVTENSTYYVTVRVDTDKIARVYPCSEDGVITAGASPLSAQNPLVVTNAKMKNGSIQLTKTITNRLTQEDETKEFTFVLYEKTSNGSMQTTNKSIKVKHGNSATVTGLELGKTYYLAEEADAVYKLNSISIGETAITPETIEGIAYYPVQITGSAPVALTAVNEPRTFSGDITINKAVVNTFMLKDNGLLGVGQNKFTFTLKGPENFETTIRIDVKKDGTGTAETADKPQGGWPQGTYVLTETEVEDKDDRLEKYTLTSNRGSVSDKTITFTIDGSNVDSTEDISIVATNTLKTVTPGNIVLKKIVDSGKELLADDQKFTFTITAPNGETVSVEIGKSEIGESGKSITEQLTNKFGQSLPIGQYTIEEAEDSLYELVSVTGKVGDKTAESDRFTLTEQDGNKLITIEAHNKVKNSETKMVVEKELNLDQVINGNSINKNFTFTMNVPGNRVLQGTVTAVSGKNTKVTWKENGNQVDLEQMSLPYGQYTITESADPNYETAWMTDVTGTEKTGTGNTVTFTLMPESNNLISRVLKTIIGTPTRKVVFTNTLNSGTITFVKVDSVTGNSLAGATFALYRASDVSEGVLGENAKPLVSGVSSAEQTGAVTFGPIAPGEYAIVETEAVNGYVKSDAVISVVVAADGKVTFISGVQTNQTDNSNKFGNAPIKKTITLEKTFEATSNNADAWAEFGLYSDSACETNSLQTVRVIADSGSASFSNPVNPGTYYVKEIQAAPGYVVSEKIYTVTAAVGEKTNVIVAIDENKLENFTGVMKITKELSGGQWLLTETPAEFRFGIYQTSTDSTPIATVTASLDKDTVTATAEITITDAMALKVNKTYYLKETMESKFAFVKMVHGNGTVTNNPAEFILTPKENSDGLAQMTVTNTAAINKSVHIGAKKEIVNGSENIAEENFTVKLSKTFGSEADRMVATGVTAAMNTGSMPFDLNGVESGETKTADMEAGWYQVEEVASQTSNFVLLQTDGIQVKLNGTVVTVVDGKFYLPYGTNKVEILVKNEPATSDTAGLVVTKEFEGGQSLAKGKRFTFELTKRGDESFKKTGQVVYDPEKTSQTLIWDENQDSSSLTGLQLGDYLLSEISGTEDFTNTPVEIAITGAETTSYAYTTRNVAKTDGSFTLSKHVTDSGDYAKGRTFTFTLLNEDTNQSYQGSVAYDMNEVVADKVVTWTVGDGAESQSLTNLPYGTYVISEGADQLFDASFVRDDGTEVADGRFVIDHQQQTIVLTANNAPKTRRDVTITKRITERAVHPDASQFSFDLYDITDGKSVRVASAENVLADAAAEFRGITSAQPYDFIVGHTYRVTERNHDYYKLTDITGTGTTVTKNIRDNSAEFTVTDAQTTIAITAVNARKTGTMMAQKIVSGPNPDAAAEFTITLTPANNNSTSFQALSRTMKAGEAAVNLGDLVYGETYTVSESSPSVQFEQVSIVIQKGNGTNVDLKDLNNQFTMDESFNGATIQVTNQAKQSNTVISINKKLTGGYSLTSDKTFTITLKDSDGSILKTENLDAALFSKEKTVGEAFKAENLRYGTYTIEETISQAVPTYEQSIPEGTIAGTYDTKQKVFTFTVSPSTQDGYINIVNQPIKNGSLEIRKVIEDESVRKFVHGKSITFQVTNEDTGKTYNTTVQYSSKADAENKATLNSLPHGTYSIQEINVDGAPIELDYFSGLNTEDRFVVNGSTAVELDAYNKPLTAAGNVKVAKVVTEENEAIHENRDNLFGFELYDLTEDTTTAVAVSETEIGADETTTFVKPGTKTPYEFTYGHRYEVRETENKDYQLVDYTDNDNEEGDANIFQFTNAEKEIVITAENKIRRGSLRIEKLDAENNQAKLDGVTFELYPEELTSRPNIISKVVLNNAPYKKGKTVNGILEFTDIPLGRYTLFETESAKNYVTSDQGIVVDVTEEGVTTEVVITNQRKTLRNPSIKVNKVADGHDLAGKEFKFTLYRVGDVQVSEMAVKASTTGIFNLAQAKAGIYYIVEEESPLYETTFSADGVRGFSIFDSTVQLGEQIKQLDGGGTERRFYFDLTEDNVSSIQMTATNTVNRTGVQVSATKEWTADESVLNAPDTMSFSFKLEQKSADKYVLIAEGAAADIQSDVPSTIIWTMKETQQKVGELKNLEYGTYRISEVIAADAEFTLAQVMINGVSAEEISGGYEFELSENTANDVAIAFTNSINYQGKPDDDDGLIFDKVRAGNPGRKLAGAEFTLYRQVTDNPAEDVKSVENQIGNTGEFISDASGVVRVAGVIPGNYILKETKAPTGYQVSSQLITFTVNHDGRTTNVKGLTEQTNANSYFANSPISGGGTPGGDPSGGGTTITPERVPLAMLPEDQSVITIDDGEIPLAPIPKTGESSESAKMMLFISGMMMAAAIALGKKKEEE